MRILQSSVDPERIKAFYTALRDARHFQRIREGKWICSACRATLVYNDAGLATRLDWNELEVLTGSVECDCSSCELGIDVELVKRFGQIMHDWHNYNNLIECGTTTWRPRLHND